MTQPATANLPIFCRFAAFARSSCIRRVSSSRRYYCTTVYSSVIPCAAQRSGSYSPGAGPQTSSAYPRLYRGLPVRREG
jgi:hypothetical protein